MNKIEGLRRIAKGIGYLGYVPLILTVIYMLMLVADGEEYPKGGLGHLLEAGLVLAIFKGIEWIILGFVTPKRTE
jgi:hypothetical protein